MKYCPDCGASNHDHAEFCVNCGHKISDGQSSILGFSDSIKDTVSTLFGNRTKGIESTVTDSAAQESNDNLIAPNEKVQATIGVSYMQNLISGEGFKNGAAILTDKRLYYFGRSFSNVGREINTTTEESIVSVEDITFTRFVHGSPLSLLVTAIASFVLAMLIFVSIYGSTDDSAGMLSFMIIVFLAIGVVFLVAYQAGKSTVLEIAFPGGKYCFNANGTQCQICGSSSVKSMWSRTA